MGTRKPVIPISAEGNDSTLFELFGIGPLWTITCGACCSTFKKRLPLVDNPGIVCPNCQTTNVLHVIWESDSAQ